jgi:hypothetical protein
VTRPRQLILVKYLQRNLLWYKRHPSQEQPLLHLYRNYNLGQLINRVLSMVVRTATQFFNLMMAIDQPTRVLPMSNLQGLSSIELILVCSFNPLEQQRRKSMNQLTANTSVMEVKMKRRESWNLELSR